MNISRTTALFIPSREDILAEIDRYLAQTGMAPATLGKQAVNDTAFVFKLRRGRSVGMDRLRRVFEYMTNHPPPPSDSS